MIDYQVLLEKYMRAVIGDDHIVGLRCADIGEGYCEDLTEEEAKALSALALRIWAEEHEQTSGEPSS